MSQRQRGIDPAVAELLVQAERRKAARGVGVLKQKVNLNLPSDLVNAIRQEAFALTGHKRRGFSDLMVVLLRHGWDAYQAGDLEVELQPAAIEMRITAAELG